MQMWLKAGPWDPRGPCCCDCRGRQSKPRRREEGRSSLRTQAVKSAEPVNPHHGVSEGQGLRPAMCPLECGLSGPAKGRGRFP